MEKGRKRIKKEGREEKKGQVHFVPKLEGLFFQFYIPLTRIIPKYIQEIDNTPKSKRNKK